MYKFKNKIIMNNSNKIYYYVINTLIIFFLAIALYGFMSGWGSGDNPDYSKINDSNMNCAKILQDVDRLGLWEYLTNGKPDANKHYYQKVEQQHQKRKTNDFRGQNRGYNEIQGHILVNKPNHSSYHTRQEPLVQDRKTQRAIRKAEKATQKFWNGHHR